MMMDTKWARSPEIRNILSIAPCGDVCQWGAVRYCRSATAFWFPSPPDTSSVSLFHCLMCLQKPLPASYVSSHASTPGGKKEETRSEPRQKTNRRVGDASPLLWRESLLRHSAIICNRQIKLISPEWGPGPETTTVSRPGEARQSARGRGAPVRVCHPDRGSTLSNII